MKIITEKRLATAVLALLLFVVFGYVSSARADRWDWRNNPDRFGGTMVTELSQLPQSGEVEQLPWPPSYMPLEAADGDVPGSLFDAAEKYDVAFHGWSPDLAGEAREAEVPDEDALQAAGPLTEWMSDSMGYCAAHDDLDSDGDGMIDEQEDVGDDEFYFWGPCHSWVAAAINEPEPRSPVLEEGVEFTAAELKALLALEWASAASRYVGGICSVGDETLTVDEDGFIIEPECADTNPGAFHVLLANLLGVEGRSFAVDHSMFGDLVMLPLVAYEVLRMEEVDAEGASALLGRQGMDYPFNPDAVSFVQVETEVTSADPSEADGMRIDLYTYLLEIDGGGDILGGRWTGESADDHPDFTWLPDQNGTDTDLYEPEQVDDLVQRSQAGDRDGDGVLDGVDICPEEDASGLDADGDGCVDRVADLADLVSSLGLHRGTERALVASAESAARDNGLSAVHKLGAFVNKVEAQRDKKIDADQANLLVAFAAHASADLQGAE